MAHRERHRSERIGWLRAAVLGANDGIVSTASLVVGVAAAEATRQDVLIAGIAGLVAGALSMAAGEYVSVSSQADTEQADLEAGAARARDRPASGGGRTHGDLREAAANSIAARESTMTRHSVASSVDVEHVGDDSAVGTRPGPGSLVWHTQPIDSVIEAFGTSPDGLTADEAALRLDSYGPNELQTLATVIRLAHARRPVQERADCDSPGRHAAVRPAWPFARGARHRGHRAVRRPAWGSCRSTGQSGRWKRCDRWPLLSRM